MSAPVMRSKAEVERHHDMDRAGNLLPCADRRCGVLGLTIVARQSGWEHSDNQDGHFGGRGERIFVAARR
jgi:hypothetical protein